MANIDRYIETIDTIYPDGYARESLFRSAGEMLSPGPAASARTWFGRLIVTMQTDASFFTRAKEEAAVDGYVLKLDAFEELVKAVRAVAAGRKFVSPSLAADLVWSRETASDGAQLTRRELQVVSLVAEGLSSHEIGRRLGISRRTVETYRANLREKLGLVSNADLVRYAIKSGLARL